MEWQKPYIIVRKSEQGIFQVVHEAATMKDARYWLAYIALNGDALFQTAAHPKYQGDGTPVYVSHLIKRGQVATNEAVWKREMGIDADIGARLVAPQ